MIAPDSSVVIAALAPWHEAHRLARAALVDGEVRLPAHVAFETTSALSRMPEGRRIAPAVVLEALQRGFSQPWLAMDADGLRDALLRAVEAGVRGGALYDALIAATVAAQGGEILSADPRALATYRAMDVEVRFVNA
ncbi:MAG TPA: PIN domain-containing protein [Solirubrobacteraceae bacterium]